LTLWHGAHTCDALNAHSRGTMVEHLDIRFTEIGADYLCATMPVDARTRQPMGLLHGGASVVLAETLGSTGATLCVDPDQYQCVGLDINANHVGAARGGVVTGTTRPFHIGGRTQVWSIEVVNEAQKLICVARLTVAVIKRGALG
jgi:uncharacterized protein (TIGR00369 family)